MIVFRVFQAVAVKLPIVVLVVGMVLVVHYVVLVLMMISSIVDFVVVLFIVTIVRIVLYRSRVMLYSWLSLCVTVGNKNTKLVV